MPDVCLLSRILLNHVPKDECAQYMLYALFDAERGVFFRDNQGEIVSSHIFSADNKAHFADDSPTARKIVRISSVSVDCFSQKVKINRDS